MRRIWRGWLREVSGPEKRPGYGFFGYWLFIGAIAWANRALPPEAWSHAWPRYLAIYAVAESLWAGTVGGVMRRSLTPLGIGLPMALISLLLSDRYIAPFDAQFALAGILIVFPDNGIGLGFRFLIRRSKWRVSLPSDEVSLSAG